ncbi:MAG: TrmH family RNA methyltransferase [Planctomycetota bacterium]|nr:MAG: TrmH family RNA methyltransferase [Planctomycetota bacterium]
MHDAVNRPLSRELPSLIPLHPAEHLLSSQRVMRFRQVLARRSGRLSMVIEECYDPQNATAIVRTCDCLGIHRLHVITERNHFQVNRRVSQGAHLNLDLRVHDHIDEAYAQLREDGFRILASDLANDAAVGPGALQSQLAEHPLALVFGNEGHGLSEAAIAGADGRFLIPMTGFSQSLNLSVSVAICAYVMRQEALEQDLPGDLPVIEQARWFDSWLKRSKRVEQACQDLGWSGPDGLPPLHPLGRESLDRRGNPCDSIHSSHHSDPDQPA